MMSTTIGPGGRRCCRTSWEAGSGEMHLMINTKLL
jgi:hypothetical protein